MHRRAVCSLTAALVAGCAGRGAAPPAGSAAAAAPSASIPTSAASAASGSGPAPSLLARIQALGLSVDRGRIVAYHADGQAERARRLRLLIEAAMDFYRVRLGVEAPLHLAVLTRAQWDAVVRWQPYGIPGVAGRPPVIFMPAGDDGLAAEDALGLRQRLTPQVQARLAAAGLDFDAAARRYVDLVGLHELGHTYARAHGLHTASRWLDEWLASFYAYAFLQERRPAQARLWEAVLMLYRDGVVPEHRSLEAFDRLYFGVGARNYVWYQAQFQRQVEAVLARHGLAALEGVREALRALPAEPSARLVIEQLELRLPGFRGWAASLEAA